jgi:hypothetical protein
MTYDDYVKESTKDLLNYEEVDLDEASLKIPSLLHRWADFMTAEKIKMRQIERQQNEWYKIMYSYYAGKLSKEELDEYNLHPFPHKLLKQDIDTWINADPKLNDIEDTRILQEQKINFIDRKMKELSTRQWNIKAAIDHRKFMSGG